MLAKRTVGHLIERYEELVALQITNQQRLRPRLTESLLGLELILLPNAPGRSPSAPLTRRFEAQLRQREGAMQRWEYCSLRVEQRFEKRGNTMRETWDLNRGQVIAASLDDVLNGYGLEGWELVSIVLTENDRMRVIYRAVCKRPKG